MIYGIALEGHQQNTLFKREENECWQIVKKVTLMRFAELYGKMPSAVWQDDYDAMLKHPWPFKSLMSMRLCNVYSDYVL